MAGHIEHQPLALVPNASYLSFQLYCHSSLTKKEDPDQKLVTAVKTAFSWLLTRFRNISEIPEEIILPDDPDISCLKSFQIDDGYYLSAAFCEERRKWAFRLIEPDMGPNPGKSYNRAPVPGRLYQTDVAFSLSKDKLECGFKTQCVQPVNCEMMNWEVFRLKLVKMLIGSIGLDHVKPLKMKPYRNMSVSSIASLINNPHRQIPVILVTQETATPNVQTECMPVPDLIKAGVVPFAGVENQLARLVKINVSNKEYIDVNSIAARTVGFAHTCYVATEKIKPLSYRIGRYLNPMGGEISVVMPVKCYPENDWFYTRKEIRSYGNETGEKGELLSGYVAFEQALVKQISNVTKQNICIEYGELLFLNDIRILENKQLKTNENLEVLVTAYEKESRTNQQIISDLKRERSGFKKTLAEVGAENRKLQARLDVLMEQNREMSMEIHEELNNKKLDISRLQKEIEYLESKPYRYKDLIEWIEREFSHAIILTEKAKASLKAGAFENIALLCDAVKCLANNFLDFAAKEITFEEYLTCLKVFGLEHKGDSSVEAKKTYSSYKPEYPEGSGKYVELKMHLRTNTDKSYDKHDPRGVLRIYFTYDDELKKVVIHHLPGHLPT